MNNGTVLAWFHTAPGQPRLAAGRQPSWRRVLPVALLGLLVAAALAGGRAGLPDGFDPTAPFVVGERTGIDQELRVRGVSLSSELSYFGYDGQWYLGQASDPLLRTDLPLTFDAPRYRSQRVLFPATGWLLAAGHSPATPYALLLVGVLAVGLGCACCARIVAGYQRSRWWGALFAVIPGVLVGVAYGTAEPLALALAALGVALAMDRRYGWAGLAFAGSALTKETYLAFAAGTALYLLVDGLVNRWPGWRPAGTVLAPGAASLAGWLGYVTLTLPPENFPSEEPLAAAVGIFDRFSPPFVGWAGALGSIATGEYPGGSPLGVPGELVMVVTFVVLVAAAVLALWLRQSLLAYLAFGWAVFGLAIAGFLLERYGSASRALAPAVLAAGLFLATCGGSWSFSACRRARRAETPWSRWVRGS